VTSIYLAEPIDKRTQASILAANRTAEVLQAAGYNLYRPGYAWTCSGAPEATVQQVNNEALSRCAAVVAVLAKDTATVGVTLEIARASQQGIPVVVVMDWPSFALATLPGVQALANLDDLLAVLETAIHSRQARLERDAYPRQVVLGRSLGEVSHDPTDCTEYRGEPHLGGCVVRQPVIYEWTVDGGVPLNAHHEGDAGWDLYVTEDTTIPAGAYALIPAGIKIAWPAGYWGLILPRSSTLAQRGLMVSPAVIDNGWRGNYYAAVWNLSNKAVVVKVGERLAQVVPMPLTVDTLEPIRGVVPNDTSRGENGFGSTDTYSDEMTQSQNHADMLVERDLNAT
jgi:dUTP pyrophosphatase